MYYRTIALLKFYLPFLLFTLFLGACQEKSNNAIIYKKPIAEKMDPVYSWLAIRYNFNKPQFKRVFYTYYNKKIKEKKYKSAAKVLEVVSLTYSSYS